MTYYSPFDPTQEVGASEYKALKQDFDATQAQKTASAIVKPETPNTQNTQVGSLSNTLTEDVKEVVPNLSNALTGTTISSQPANSLLDTYKESYTKFETDTQKRIEQLENEKQQRFSEIENVFGEEQARLTERQGEQTKTEEAMGFRLGTDKGTPYGVDRLKNLTKEHQYQQSLLQRQKQDALNKISAAISDEKFQLASQLRAEYKDMLSFEANERDRQSREYAQAFNQALQMRQEQRETEKYEFEREETLASSLAFNLVGLDDNFEVIEATTEEIMAAAREMNIDPNILFSAMSKQAKELRKESREERGSYFERQKFAADLRQKTLENSIAQEKLNMEREIFGYELSIKQSESMLKEREVEQKITQQFFDQSGNPSLIAINNAIGNLKLSKDDRDIKTLQIQRQLANGDYLGAKETLVTAARQSAGVDQSTRSIGRSEALGALNRIESALNQWYAAGGDTGILVGTDEKIRNKLGETKNPELAKIANTITSAMVDYRRAVSGAAFTEGESKVYEEMFPSTSKSKELNTAKISSLKETFQSNETIFMEQQLGSRTWNAVKDIGSVGGTFQPITNFADLYSRQNKQLIDLYKKYDAMPEFTDVQSIIEAVNAEMGSAGEAGGGFEKVVQSKYPPGSIGGQCGVFAHKLVKFPNVGDLKEQKFASVDKFGIKRGEWLKLGPQIGDVIITNEDPDYGHVAVINKILPNGDIVLSESNYKQKDKVSHDRKISKNSSKIYGVIRGEYKV